MPNMMTDFDSYAKAETRLSMPLTTDHCCDPCTVICLMMDGASDGC